MAGSGRAVWRGREERMCFMASFIILGNGVSARLCSGIFWDIASDVLDLGIIQLLLHRWMD